MLLLRVYEVVVFVAVGKFNVFVLLQYLRGRKKVVFLVSSSSCVGISSTQKVQRMGRMMEVVVGRGGGGGALKMAVPLSSGVNNAVW